MYRRIFQSLSIKKLRQGCLTEFLEPRVGLEPTTFSLRMKCSNQLSYCGLVMHGRYFLQLRCKGTKILWIVGYK